MKKKNKLGLEGGNKIVNVWLLEIKLQTIQTVFFLVVPWCVIRIRQDDVSCKRFVWRWSKGKLDDESNGNDDENKKENNYDNNNNNNNNNNSTNNNSNSDN